MDYEKPFDQPPGLLHLPDELRARIEGYGASWPQSIPDSDLAGRDFAWLRALAQFDRWSILGAGRLGSAPAGNLYTDSIPNYTSLLRWAKLRYVAGLRAGDAAAASVEVRHLAELMRTQGILVAELSALMLYRFDAQAREAAAAEGQDVSAWPAPDLDQLDRARRVAFASLYFTYPGVREETVRAAVGCVPMQCTALIEGAAANRSFGAYGSNDHLKLLSDLGAKGKCETAMMERIAHAQELPAGEALEALSNEIPKFFPR
jgi:hypothetical protein